MDRPDEIKLINKYIDERLTMRKKFLEKGYELLARQTRSEIRKLTRRKKELENNKQ